MKVLSFFAKSKNKISDSDTENLHNKVQEIDDALELINQGYNKLVKLGYRKPRTYLMKAVKYFTIIASIISVLFAYQQYLERNLEARIDNQEQLFGFTTRNFESTSPAVRAAGVKSLSELAFTELFKEPESGIFSPAVNLANWIFSKKEFRFLERSRIVFSEFAKSKRNNDEVLYDAVSTTIINTGLNWINREVELLSKSKNDNSLWFFYRADLSKANAPNVNFVDVMFYDVDLSNSKLTGGVFDRCYLESSNFNGSNLESSSFKDANLITGNFNKTKLNYSNLSNVLGTRSTFSQSDLTLAKIKYSHFTYANFDSTVFRTADLSNTDFTGAKFRYADFQNANLDGCNFSKADLSYADLTLAQNIDKVKSWSNAITKGAKFPQKKTNNRR